eukprot:s255_g7.t1
MPLTFHRRYSAGLRAIPAFLRKLFLDSRLREAYNQTTDDVIKAMHTTRSMKEYVGDLPLDEEIIAKGRSEAGLYQDQIVDYIFPVMVSAQEFYESACPELFAEAQRTLRRLRDFAADGRPNSPKFKQMYPVLFVAPAGSRAIPLHQHGPYNDNLLWMLHGSKRVVVSAPSSTEWLYERPEFGGSEYADRVFSADIVQPDAGRQPNVAFVRGMEGVVNAGELIYLPVNTPHAVQTTESSPSVMLAWQMPVPGRMARMFFMKDCSYLEELSDYPPWQAKCSCLGLVFACAMSSLQSSNETNDICSAQWLLLWTTAAYAPEVPNKDEKESLETFFGKFQDLCRHGPYAEGYKTALKSGPPPVSSRRELMLWLCMAENRCLKKEGLPVNRCSYYDLMSRWRYADGYL